MTGTEFKRYRFERPRHWRAGVSDQLAVGANGLSAPAKVVLEPVPGSGPADETRALAVDPCGDVYWVRSRSFELVRALAAGTLTVGRLEVADQAAGLRPAGLALGFHRLWLLAESPNTGTRLLRYDRARLQRLAGVATARAALAICSDRADGVWLVLGDDSDKAELAYLDAAGDRLPPEVELPASTEAASVAVSADRSSVFVLDSRPLDPCLAWRLWRIDVRCGKASVRKIFGWPKRNPACPGGAPDFHPDLLAVGDEERVHLVDGGSGAIWTLAADGVVLARHAGLESSRRLPIVAAAAHPGGRQTEEVLVSGSRGIARLRRGQEAEPGSADSLPTYVTPALVSPDGTPRGWTRADLDADLPDGAAIEVNVAATKDAAKIAEVGELFAGSDPPALRLGRIEAALPWLDDRTEIYRGGAWPSGRPLRYSLHEIDATHLWLRLRVHSAPDKPPPAVRSMRVLYPDLSYTRYLPAVYLENPAAAKLLRRLLAIFESVFGDLESELGELPRRIDPRTAPEAWLPFLLSWLGLPAPTELEPADQRKLLGRAAELLSERGTARGLERLLEILVGGDFEVVDSGAGPAPWTLPAPCRPAFGPRLGCDTLVLEAQQPGFRLGHAALGQEPLGFSTLEPARLCARRTGAVEIRVAAHGSRRQRLEPLLRRYLPYFVPAHCRLRLRFVAAGELRRVPRLGPDLRLGSDGPARLGDDARAGSLRLAGTAGEGIFLDESTFLDPGLVLS